MELDQALCSRLREGVEAAGRNVLVIYERDFTVETKADDSPLTEADLVANRLLIALLQEVSPDVPILSEESAMVPYSVRRAWDRYWLIDPIDGTKEFINRNGEFTLNVALIERGVPIFGIVHAPVLASTWWGGRIGGAWKRQGDQTSAIHVRDLPNPEHAPWKIVGSRLHGAAAFETFCQYLPRHERVSMGSSLKLCLVAEGKADLYPRLAPTSEWDTAAAHAIVLAAGGEVANAATLEPLRYNGRESLVNPDFVVYAKRDPRWEYALSQSRHLITGKR